jgi:hypothetical protein
MAGGRSLGGVPAGAGGGTGAGVPGRNHPVLGRVPRWGSVAQRGIGRVRLSTTPLRRLGSGDAPRRVLPAVVAGRTTPGLRTVTVVAAAGSGIRAGRALAVLLLRRGRRGRAARVLAEGACPACLALGLLAPTGQPASATDPTGA